MPRLSDEYNRDDWDGSDWREELMDAESSLRLEAPQGIFSLHEHDIATGELPQFGVLDEKGYVEHWRSIAAEIRRKACYRCQKCGVDLSDKKWLLDVHHLDREKLNNEEWNLIAVCRLCHSGYEGHEGLLRKTHQSDINYISAMKIRRNR